MLGDDIPIPNPVIDTFQSKRDGKLAFIVPEVCVLNTLDEFH
jgi:hypothetical protein